VITEGTLGGESAGCKPLQTMPKMVLQRLTEVFGPLCLLPLEQLRVEERLDYRGGQIPLSFCVWRFLAHQFLQCQCPLNHCMLCCHVDLLPM
jgi:hypothetical protein